MTLAVPAIANAVATRAAVNANGWTIGTTMPKTAHAASHDSAKPAELSRVTARIWPVTTPPVAAGVATSGSSEPFCRSRSMISPEVNSAMVHSAMRAGARTAYGARSVRPACSVMDRNMRVMSGAVISTIISSNDLRSRRTSKVKPAASPFTDLPEGRARR